MPGYGRRTPAHAHVTRIIAGFAGSPAVEVPHVRHAADQRPRARGDLLGARRRATPSTARACSTSTRGPAPSAWRRQPRRGARRPRRAGAGAASRRAAQRRARARRPRRAARRPRSRCGPAGAVVPGGARRRPCDLVFLDPPYDLDDRAVRPRRSRAAPRSGRRGRRRAHVAPPRARCPPGSSSTAARTTATRPCGGPALVEARPDSARGRRPSRGRGPSRRVAGRRGRRPAARRPRARRR